MSMGVTTNFTNQLFYIMPNKRIVKKTVIKRQRHVSQMSSEEYCKTHLRRVRRIPKNFLTSDAIIVDLIYFDQTYSRTQNGFAFLSYRMRMNSAFDPDPALSSGAIPGFTDWANLYNSYRVLVFKYDIEVSNQEAFAIDVLTAPSTTDLGLNYTNSYDLLGNPFGKSHTLSAMGGMDKARFRGTIDLGQFSGNLVQYCGDDAFGSGVGTNPASIIYMNVAAVATLTFNTGKGIFTKGKFEYTVLFYGRKIQTT
jgi:hypothetical protein